MGVGSGGGSSRSWLMRTLTALTFVVSVLATLMVFAQDRLFDASSFSTTVTSTTTDPAVNEYLATAMADALIEQAPNLAIIAPMLERICGQVLESDRATESLEQASESAHIALFSGQEDTLLMNLSELVVPVDDALTALNPDLADVIDDDVAELSVEISAGELVVPTVRLAERLRFLTFVLVAISAVGLLAVVALASNLLRGLHRMGSVLGLVGLLLIVTRAVGSTVVASYGRTELEADALAGVWNVVLGDLRTLGWLLVLVGAVVAGLGTAGANQSRIADEMSRRWDYLIDDDAPLAIRVGRVVVGFLVSIWALTQPLMVASVAVRLFGFVALFTATGQLARMLGLPERLAATEPEAIDRGGPVARGARLIAPVFVIIGIGIGLVVLLSANDNASAASDPDACNGHRELCERRLDEVTLATSHNSMSSTSADFYLPNHLSTMRAQLNQGVRGFMIDTVYGRPTSDGTIRTSVESPDLETLGEQGAALYEQALGDQPDDLGDEAVYLCHSVCEIGSVDAVDELTVVRQWLDDNPREVVVFVVQDATEPDDTAAVFEQAGFADMIHTQTLGEPFPTLGEMVDSGQRVFVMVEESGDGVPWLHEALDFTQETPFSFASVEEFSCEENRGDPDAPLFVINHFITLAKPSNETINDVEVLGERAETCATERGLQPNLLAVDFISEGDVMAVVDALNDVD